MSESKIRVTFDLEACISVLEELFHDYEDEYPMVNVMLSLEAMAYRSGMMLPDVNDKPWSTFRRHRVGLQAAAPVLKQHCRDLGVDGPRWEEMLVTLSDTLWESEDNQVSMSTWLEQWLLLLPEVPFYVDKSFGMLADVYNQTLEALDELGPFIDRRAS